MNPQRDALEEILRSRAARIKRRRPARLTDGKPHPVSVRIDPAIVRAPKR